MKTGKCEDHIAQKNGGHPARAGKAPVLLALNTDQGLTLRGGPVTSHIATGPPRKPNSLQTTMVFSFPG
jgi:hypothetical protein